MTTSIFDLPDTLAAKRAEQLTGADERFFAGLVESLRNAVGDLERRIAELRLAPGAHGEAALNRDLEIHRLTARLQTLRRFGPSMCLGRMLDVDGTTIHVGRLGLTDTDGRRPLIDWRSPTAEPFFAATQAHPMGLSARRRYRWTDGRITDYWDELLGADDVGNHASLDARSAFVASLAEARSPRMRDVLGTIAADQDAVIRADSRGALVVDGGPGTGKTVVALHRAAYLLYADPHLGGHRGGVLFVGPSRPYLEYVSDVLPGLGEDGVRTCTLRDLVPEGRDATTETDDAVAQTKASLDPARIVDAAVALYEEPPSAATTIETPWCEVVVTVRDWVRVFAVVDPDVAHNDARELAWDEFVSVIVDRHPDDVDPELVRASLRQNRDVVTLFGRAWPLLEATDIVGDLWNVPAYLRRCAPTLSAEEVRTLQRADASAWTTSDLPLLDAAHRRLGDPKASLRRRRRRDAEAAQRSTMRAVIDDLIAADDSELLLMTSLRHGDLQDALVDEADDDDDRDPLAGPFAHVVVDEAQELTDAEWQMVLTRCPSRSLTIVGDRAQARRGFAESWQKRLDRVGLDSVALTSLRLNYRTPSEIMSVAEPAIRAALPDANVPVSVRDSGVAVRYGTVAELDTVIAEWLAAEPDGVACVIGAPDFEPTTRVRSLSAALAKGLEFDLVVLVEPDAFGRDVAGAVDRYVAMTRATERLVVLTG